MPLLPIRASLFNAGGLDSKIEAGGSPPMLRQDGRKSATAEYVRIKNRRRAYLDRHPSYFGPSLELADPLLYDRLIRRYQSASERESEGRAKGYANILEASLLRAEAKVAAATTSTTDNATADTRASAPKYYSESHAPVDGRDVDDDDDDDFDGASDDGGELNRDEVAGRGDGDAAAPAASATRRARAEARWREIMTKRFLRGGDQDFDYAAVDGDETLDDTVLEEREAQESWFDEEEPGWVDPSGDGFGGDGGGGKGGSDGVERTGLTGQTGIQDF